MIEEKMLDLIPTGKKNARGCKELSMITGIPERQLKKAVSRLRCNGVIICSSLDSSQGGYFKPASLEELREYVTVEQKRIRTAQAALRAARNEVKRRSEHGNNN